MRPERLAVVVTGDRHAEAVDWQVPIYNRLEELWAGYHHAVLIHGGARGIDTIAERVATLSGWSVVPVPADFSRGYWAGPARNRTMLKMLHMLADHGYEVRVLAFHDDLEGSKGTKDCVKQAIKMGFEVEVVRSDGA